MLVKTLGMKAIVMGWEKAWLRGQVWKANRDCCAGSCVRILDFIQDAVVS